MDQPYVSVVIPTYNRESSLRETLDSFAHQTWPADRFEIVVVDDGSTDDTSSVGNDPCCFTLRYICQQNKGSAAARNAGARQSCGEILVFVDDDMTTEPTYLSGLVEELRHHDRVIAMGTLRPWVPLEGVSPYQSAHAEFIFHKERDSSTGWASFDECTSNNMAMEREAFFTLGMWQDLAGDGQTLWGDVDFGYRAYRAGFRFRRSDRAIIYHRDHAATDLVTACRRAETAASRVVFLFQKHPELEPQLSMFRDKSPIHLQDDSPRLVSRKLLRRLVSSGPSLRLLERTAQQLEKRWPRSSLLHPLYRWIIGGYILKGYRQGPGGRTDNA